MPLKIIKKRLQKLADKKTAEPLKISKLLLADKQDLIHKAVGWMPRNMLRYAIEKLPFMDGNELIDRLVILGRKLSCVAQKGRDRIADTAFVCPVQTCDDFFNAVCRYCKGHFMILGLSKDTITVTG